MKKVNFKLYFRFSIIHWCTEGKNPFMVHAKQKQNENKTKQNAKQTKIVHAKRVPKFSRGNIVHFGWQVI